MRPRHRHALFAVAFGLLSPLVLGCGSAGQPGETVDSLSKVATPHPYFTGEEVFRGTMFGTGPVADLLPEIWKRPELAQAAARAKSVEFQPSLKAKLDVEMEAVSSSEPDISPATIARFKTLMESVSKAPVDQRAAATAAAQAKMQRLLLRVIHKSDPSFFTRFAAQMQSGNQIRIDAAVHEATKHLVEAITRLAPSKGTEDGCGACGACGQGQASCGQGQGQGSCGQGQGQGSCGQGQGQGSCGQGQSSCGQGQGQTSCGQGAVGGSGNDNWFYNTNYVYTVNWGAISNAVAGVTAVAAGAVAVIILAFFWDPTESGGKDGSGLEPDHTLQRQIVIDSIASRLRAT
jgi:hypothetical protein